MFDWPEAVQWTDDVADDQVVLHFDHGVAGDPSVLLKPLGTILSNVLVSTDKKTVTLRLKVPVTVKGFNTPHSTVFDLTPHEAGAKQVPAAKEPVSVPPVQPTAAPKGPKVDVRGAKHEDFNRIVFQWPGDVGMKVSSANGKMDVEFDHPGQIPDAQVIGLLPPGVSLDGIRPSGNGVVVSLTVPPGTSEHHYADKGKAVFDLKVDPKAAKAAPPAPQQPVKDALPIAQAAPAPVPVPPLVAAAKPAPAVAAPVAAPPAPPAAEPPLPLPEEPPQGATLTLGFDQPANAAVFTRAGWWWLVFDRKSDADPGALRQAGGRALLQMDAVPVKKGSAIRLLLAEGFQPVPKKNGKNWVFDLAIRERKGPTISYVPEKQFDFQDRGRVVMKVPDPAKEEVVLRDPEVGDSIHVVPVGTAGAGLREELDIPEADLLPTIQGLAMVPRAERAWLDSTHGNVQLTMAGGLTMSRGAKGPNAEGHLSAETAPEPDLEQPIAREPMGEGDPIDPIKWARGGIKQFDPDHAELIQRAMQEPPARRVGVNVEIARHYLANGFDAEALGTLRGAALQDPSIVDTPNFRAVRGLASLLMHRFPEAIEDLSHPSLRNDPKAPMWAAAARVASGAPMLPQAAILHQAADEMRGMPAPLRMALGRPAALSLMAAGDQKAAGKVINGMDGPGISDANKATLAYLGGLAAEANKQYDEAVKRYRFAEAGKSMEERAYAAHNRIQIDFNQGRLSADDAIHQLQLLPYVWRGGDFEYETVKQAARMLVDAGRYRIGFMNLRDIIARYPNNPDVPNVSEYMNEVFRRLFLDGLADNLPPIQAIGLYNEFQELTPAGEKGDEMIRKLADRMAAVDLLDEASELLRHQVQYRLSGMEKSRVATRLALLDLTNSHPKEALEDLDSTEMPGMTPDLQTQRRFMRVEALADLGRVAEALALILNDNSDDAKKMRAVIYWKQKRWPEAAAALEAITDLPAPNKRLGPEQAQHVMDMATALTLGKDERGLARLRKIYGESMRASAYDEAFELLTSPPEHGIMDFHKVGDVIKQVQSFQTFLTEWQKKAKEKGLSSLN